jgi:hypothetical protein
METKITYTPAPWKIVGVITDNEPNEYHITTGQWGNSETIALVIYEPNARLISAAPELLEACKKLLGTCGHSEYVPDEKCDSCTTAKVAIAKAEGKGE